MRMGKLSREDLTNIMIQKQKPITILRNAKWLTSPSLQRLMKILCQNGIDTRFVGGCVRDSLIKKQLHDIDIGTPLLPEDVIKRLEKHNIKTIPTGIDHGTVTAILPSIQIQITTLRKDIETDGRKAKVLFTKSWLEDAARRDFTFNALSCNALGEVFDPFMGLSDLKSGIVKFIGKAEERVKEDYLRILRFFRFYASYGFAKMDQEALRACTAHKDKLKTLSAERIRDEFIKLLKTKDPFNTIEKMFDTNILQVFLPEAKDLSLFRKLTSLESQIEEIHPLSRLIALAPDKKDFMKNLALSNAIDQKITLYQKQNDPDLLQNQLKIETLLHFHSIATCRDIFFLEAARHDIKIDSLKQALLQSRLWQQTPFPLTGKDLQEIGMEPGPKMGEILKETEEWWLNNGRKADKEACLVQVRKKM